MSASGKRRVEPASRTRRRSASDSRGSGPLEVTYGDGPNGLVFIHRDTARDLDVFSSARTWGELRRGAPRLYREALERLSWREENDGDGLPAPPDSGHLDPTEIPGFEDGDFPDLPEQLMLTLLPEDIQERFGTIEESALNGPMLLLPAERELEIVSALVARGFDCRKDQELVDRIFA